MESFSVMCLSPIPRPEYLPTEEESGVFQISQSMRALSGAQPHLQLAGEADTLTPLQPRPRPTQLSLRTVLPHSIPEHLVGPKSTFSASGKMWHKKEDPGTWTSRWLLLLNNLFVHFANFLVPHWSHCSKKPPSHTPSRHTPHLPLHKDISWCKILICQCALFSRQTPPPKLLVPSLSASTNPTQLLISPLLQL